MVTQKNLRINQDGHPNANGGDGKWARFVVDPAGGRLRLRNEGHGSQYLALMAGGVKMGGGGPHCKLILVKTQYPGIVRVAHESMGRWVAIDPKGQLHTPPPAQPIDGPPSDFRLIIC